MRAVDVGLRQVAIDARGQAHQQVAQTLENCRPEAGVGFDGFLGGPPQTVQRLRHRHPTLHEHSPDQVMHGHLWVHVLDELLAVGVVHVQQAAEAGHDRPVGSAQQSALGQGLAQLLHAQQAGGERQAGMVFGVAPDSRSLKNL
jgi:hypothetical protein